MGQRKLELFEICGYLPYGLLFDTFYGVIKLTGLQSGALIPEEISEIDGKYEQYELEDVKPILRPISDLYKTITHNGKEIVPIVELAKIAYPYYDWEIANKMAFRDINKKEFIDREFFGCKKSERVKLHRIDIGYFYTIYRCDNIENIPNQVELFDFLHELKIDYRGLIDAGLAVSVYDLDSNPYN